MNNDEYFAALANQVASGLENNLAIKKFADNTDVTGAFAEASVRRLIRQIIYPLQMSNGAVISTEACAEPGTVRQVDGIIWNPRPLPAMFEVDDFGLIPRRSALATIEVKRSDYAGAAATETKHATGLHDIEERWNARRDCVHKDVAEPSFLGVVCIKDANHARLNTLADHNRAVWLLEKQGDNYAVNVPGVFVLVNFLAHVRRQAFPSQGDTSIAGYPIDQG